MIRRWDRWRRQVQPWHIYRGPWARGCSTDDWDSSRCTWLLLKLTALLFRHSPTGQRFYGPWNKVSLWGHFLFMWNNRVSKHSEQRRILIHDPGSCGLLLEVERKWPANAPICQQALAHHPAGLVWWPVVRGEHLNVDHLQFHIFRETSLCCFILKYVIKLRLHYKFSPLQVFPLPHQVDVFLSLFQMAALTDAYVKSHSGAGPLSLVLAVCPAVQSDASAGARTTEDDGSNSVKDEKRENFRPVAARSEHDC